MSASELYETETMAELFARQGRLGEAIDIYRRLTDAGAAPEARKRWKIRLGQLEARWQPGRVTEAPPADVPLPPAPGVTVLASEDQVTVAWALPGHVQPVTIELMLIQRTPAGIETIKKSLSVENTAGRLGLSAPGIHSALAAVGTTSDGRFVPLARSVRA